MGQTTDCTLTLRSAEGSRALGWSRRPAARSLPLLPPLPRSVRVRVCRCSPVAARRSRSALLLLAHCNIVAILAGGQRWTELGVQLQREGRREGGEVDARMDGWMQAEGVQSSEQSEGAAQSRRSRSGRGNCCLQTQTSGSAARHGRSAALPSRSRPPVALPPECTRGPAHTPGQGQAREIEQCGHGAMVDRCQSRNCVGRLSTTAEEQWGTRPPARLSCPRLLPSPLPLTCAAVCVCLVLLLCLAATCLPLPSKRFAALQK